MLKHNEIIAKLTDSQKIRLLTGVGNLTGKDFKILGLGGIGAGNMKDYGRDIIPSFASLANSWSRELWYSTASARVDMLSAAGAGFVIAPGAKIKLSPYRREISEDPYLASELSASHLRAAKDRGMSVGASGYYLTEGELGWLDREPSDRVLCEMLAAPYLRAARVSLADAVLTDLRAPKGEYREAALRCQDAMADSGLRICEKATEENTVSFIHRGIICLQGSANALENALNRYNKLMNMAERGESVTPEQIASEVEDGTAISPEDIDKAVDAVLLLLDACRSERREDYDKEAAESLAREAVAGSAVLLKNKDKMLPLSRDRSIAVIGNILPEVDGESGLNELVRCLEARGYRCVGAEPGYEINEVGQAHLRSRALKLAESASTVILLLGFGYENEKKIQKTEDMLLPADQMRLAEMLIREGKRVIGVIASGHSVDVEFTREFSALMLMPLYVKSAPSVLAELISGERNPGGKLAYTLYAGSDAAFYKRALYRDKYGLRSGPFVGYRYYKTAGITVGYPFGHGLSYSSFGYSELEVGADSVSLTVENKGKTAAAETVQVYIGHTASAVIRPSAELCGFERIELGPREKRRITLSFEIPKVYCDGKYLTEAGEYLVSVGSSSFDIRLSRKIQVQGATLAGDGQRIADYIQSVPNVTEDNFTLEANYGFMKRSIKNLFFGIGALAIAASIAVFNATTATDSLFLGVIAGVIAMSSVIFFISHFVDQRRSYKEQRERINSANAEHFAGAEEIPMLSTDIMFREEFDNVELESDAAAVDESDLLDELMRKYVDADFGISAAALDFVELARDRGIKLDHGVAERFLASVATSSLIIVDGLSSEDFNTFVLLASEYFGTGAYTDKLELGEERADMFFSTDTYGNSVKRPVLLALDAAAVAKEKIFLSAIDGVCEAQLKEYLKPFLGYINSPKELNDIRIYNDLGANVGYSISRNVRLIVRLSELTSVDMISAATLASAAYNIVSFVRSPLPEQPSAHHGCNRYQLDYIASKEGRTGGIPEDSYKKIDKLEKYASSRTDFKIGNKQFIAFERQIGLLRAAMGEVSEAIDGAVAVKILPSVCAAVRGKITEDDESLKDTLEFIWGEQDMPASARFVAYQQEAAIRISDVSARLAEEEARRLEELAAREAEAKEAAEREAREAAEREAAEAAAREAEEIAAREAAETEAAEIASEEAELAEQYADEGAPEAETAPEAEIATDSVFTPESFDFSGFDLSAFDFDNFDADAFDPTPFGITKEQFAVFFAAMKKEKEERDAAAENAAEYGLDSDPVEEMSEAEAAEAATMAAEAGERAEAENAVVTEEKSDTEADAGTNEEITAEADQDAAPAEDESEGEAEDVSAVNESDDDVAEDDAETDSSDAEEGNF